MADEDKALDTALRQFDAIIEAVQEERSIALEDRRFAFIAGAQWEGKWGEQFANVPMVEINKTAAGLDKIINDYRANRLTVNFRPTDDRASEETADMLDGLFRADGYRSKAQQALDNAFEEGSAGGYGAWRIVNEYEDEYDPDDDRQRISTIPIVDADQSVFWDMSAKNYDKSDAMHCFVLTAMTRAAFDKKYPDASCATWPDGLYKAHYDWYTPDIIRIAEKYEVEIVTEKRRIFINSVSDEEQRFWASELDQDDVDDLKAQGFAEQPHRMVKRRRVSKIVFAGGEVLEKKRYIAGDQIPVIPFYGQRRFIDNMERAMGHVRKAKDPQRVYNSQISKLTETASLSPREVPIFDPEQVAGFEQHWADQNIGRHAYALARALRNEDGTIAALGPIGKVTPPQLAPVLAALIQITASDITELTNSVDGADQAMSNLSADAMDIAATRTDAKSAIYMDNMKQSVQRWGEVYLSMARDVYVEEGRRVETLGDNGEDGEAILMEAHVDEVSGRYSIRNDLAKGKYKVISDVTEATTTRRDKTVKSCLNGAQVAAAFDPELASALINTAFMNMDGEGMTDLQEWMRQKAIRSGLAKPTDEEQQQLTQEAEGQQPDPTALALQAQAKDLEASALLKTAQEKKAIADTGLSEAKRVETLASAAEKGANVQQMEQQAAMPAPANDQEESRPLPMGRPDRAA